MVVLFERFHETIKETKVLYDINEAEMILLTQIIMEATSRGLSPKLTVKLFKAAAHFIETTTDLTNDFFNDFFKDWKP